MDIDKILLSLEVLSLIFYVTNNLIFYTRVKNLYIGTVLSAFDT